jgi:hypothetical protein
MSQDGTLQQYIVVPDEWVVKAPSNLSAVEAASLITAGTTAWSAIRGSLDLRADGVLEPWNGSWTEKRLHGKTVLTMGTGGVSCFAIQVKFFVPHKPFSVYSFIRTDCLRPRCHRYSHVLILKEVGFCQIPRRNTPSQLRPNSRLGARSRQNY